MIPHGVEVFIGLEPIDLRWGFDRLAGIVQERIGRTVRDGALFVFFGKRRTAIKVLFCDSGGICVFYKRLDKGVFVLPEPPTADVRTVCVDERVLDDLLDGIDVEKTRSRRTPSGQIH